MDQWKFEGMPESYDAYIAPMIGCSTSLVGREQSHGVLPRS
jgi:hypothetical protein